MKGFNGFQAWFDNGETCLIYIEDDGGLGYLISAKMKE